MLKPPAPNIPGMTDTLDFVKNLWGSMNIPGAGMPGMSGLAAPPLSTDELDKRIADLKAVESWLNMNITMLRGTIQALEVQRGTLAALKSMSASMAEAMRQSGVSTDKMGAMPFASFFTPPASTPAAGAKPAAPASPASPSSPAPGAASAAQAASGGGSAQPGAASPAGTDANAGAMGMPAAVAWWNMLQEQFTQAVASAMSPASAASAGSAGGTSAAPPAAATAPSEDAKAGAPAPAANAAPDPAPGDGAPGNGKARAARPRSDKA
jgi:hypothetical protein